MSYIMSCPMSYGMTCLMPCHFRGQFLYAEFLCQFPCMGENNNEHSVSIFNIFSTISTSFTFACHIKQINLDKYILKSLSTLNRIFDANDNALCGCIKTLMTLLFKSMENLTHINIIEIHLIMFNLLQYYIYCQ